MGAVLDGRFDWSDPEVLAYLTALEVAPDSKTSREYLLPLKR